MNRLSKMLGFVLVALSIAPVLAQNDCPALVQQALTAADQACQSLKRNQACYGNVQMTAEAQANVSDFKFQSAGDIVDVAQIKTLTLSPLDTKINQWGVALMKLQADLPDTVPGQNVTMVLFGDVQITNAVGDQPPPVLLDVTPKTTANVRATPSTNGAVVGSLPSGQSVKADARTEAGDWLRVQLDGGKVGWVAMRVITVTGDVTTLPVKDASDTQPISATTYRPMQSFYFKSGVGAAPCAQAPDSGILIQTPQGAGKINLNINGVAVELGSTAYFQAQPSAAMEVSLVEGEARISAQGVTRTVPAGARVGVPLDENLQPAGAPGEIETYDDQALQPLPITLLERKVAVAPALTAAQLEAASHIVPVPGTWKVAITGAKTSAGCPAGTEQAISQGIAQQMSQTVEVTSDFDIQKFFAQSGLPLGDMEFTEPEPGVYEVTANVSGTTLHYRIQIVSSTLIQITTDLTIPGGCSITVTQEMTPV